MDKDESEKVASRPLFSCEERRKIVQKFIEAYICGTVEVSFPEIEYEKLKLATQEAKEIPSHLRITSEEHFQALLEAACVARTGLLDDHPVLSRIASEEVGSAIDKLFVIIISARQGDRIKGQLLLESPAFETRIDRLEDTMTKVTDALEGVKQWMEKYQPVLQEAEKDYGDKLGRVGEIGQDN